MKFQWNSNLFVLVTILVNLFIITQCGVPFRRSVTDSKTNSTLPQPTVLNASTNEIHTNPFDDYQIDDASIYKSQEDQNDMDAVQNDQPTGQRYQRNPVQAFGNVKRQPPSIAERREMRTHHLNYLHQPQQTHNQQTGPRFPNDDPDLIYTKDVVIKQGRIRGFVRIMHPQSGLRNVDQYLGIPYAEAPIGALRFMPPGAPPQWSGLKTATNLSSVCPQNLPTLNKSHQHLSSGRYEQLKRMLPYLKNESEDCLYLNLYVPKWSGIGPRPIYPVIVYIHGESFEWNSGNVYDGSVLSSYGQVIVVTINYRLGVLGFLKPGTSDNTASNFGLLDQVAALIWVKENIGAFGGDMGSVTLMGHGTGAACINLLMVSPVASGLFHRAILMSGSAMSDWAITSNPSDITMQILHKLNCPSNDEHEEMLKCLRKIDYSEIIKTQVTTPEFTTAFGPIVDFHRIQDNPQKLMAQQTGAFSRYDLLFGLTEIESYHSVSALGLAHGLLESERDNYLRLYMQTRYDLRPDIALAMALDEYRDIYNDPEHPTAEEHRDVVLEILSDAQVAAPLVQTGLYQSKNNPKSYMYVFAHNSKAGPYANLPQSVVGEELSYVFGAPLTSVRPFLSTFSPDERLLSEAIMVYWTNFAKTGNPKAPWRDDFLNLDPSNWDRYDIDWPEFNAGTLNYLNIGIPPVVNQNYRQRYMTFWNQHLSDELNRTLYVKNPHAKQISTATASTKPYSFDTSPSVPHVNYYLDRTTENPIRTLQFLLHHPHLNRSDMYQTQSTIGTVSVIPDSVNASPENTFMLGDNKIIVKADSTLHVLIGMVIIFLLINVVIILIYIIRRNYYNKNLKRKLDVLSLDGTTDDELKRSAKFNDGDESFILDIGRRKNEYVPVKRYHSPINGFLLSRQYSTSTVDTHTKVSDWIAQEVNRQQNLKSAEDKRTASPSFLMGGSRTFFAKGAEPPDAGVDVGPDNLTSNGTRHPALMKSKSFESQIKDKIICEEISVRTDLLDSVDLRHSNSVPSVKEYSSDKTTDFLLRIDHRYTRSDPVEHARPFIPKEEITSFIEDVDVNVTSRDECDGAASHFPLTPEETLQIYQLRNYPKVLPNYPEESSEYVSPSSFKRRSMPSYQHLLNQYARMPPVPPPRSSSTLGRRSSIRSSGSSGSMLVPTMARVPERLSPPDEEPEITYNALHVGPLLPGSRENLYSTMSRRPIVTQKSCEFANPENQEQCGNSSAVDKANQEKLQNDEEKSRLFRPSCLKPPITYKCRDDRSSVIVQPKIVIKPSINRQNSSETPKQSNIPRVHAPPDSSHYSYTTQTASSNSKIPTLKSIHSSSPSNSSSSSSSNSSNNSGKSGIISSSNDNVDNNVQETVKNDNLRDKENTKIRQSDDPSNSSDNIRSASNSSTETSSSSAETVKHIY